MPTMTIAGVVFDLTPGEVERVVAGLEPEPIHEHYVVVGGRRFPPKQVLAAMTDLDRADFTTHQARSVLRRLGFGCHRKGRPGPTAEPSPRPELSDRERRMLDQVRPFVGRWVAQEGIGGDVLFDAETPQEVVAWLRKHDKRGTIWRISADPREYGSVNQQWL